MRGLLGEPPTGGRLWYGPGEPSWAQVQTQTLVRLGLVRHFTFTGF